MTRNANPPEAGLRSRSASGGAGRLLGGLALIVLLGLLALPAVLAASRTWVPVEATVVDAGIARHRPGNLEWTLEVDLRYEVDGVEHRAEALRVLEERDREVALRSLPEWGRGRVLTVFHDSERPERVSFAEDGGFEATVVVTVLLAVVLAAVSAPFVIAARRRSARGRTEERRATPPA